MSLGVGYLTGSGIGGALYDFKGFYFPFVTVGIILMLCFFVALFTIQEQKCDPSNEQESPNKASYKKLLFQSTIMVPLINTCVSQVSVTWYITTLEPFLRDKFALGSTTAGFMLSLNGLTYALIGPLVGALLDRYKWTYIVQSTGVTVQLTGMGLLGLVPYLKVIPKSEYTTAVGLLLLGYTLTICTMIRVQVIFSVVALSKIVFY